MSEWPAPVASGPVDAVVTVPGSKSASNRALILAALAEGPSTLSGLLDARDTQLMADGLRALGVEINVVARSAAGNIDVAVQPHFLRGPASIDVGRSKPSRYRARRIVSPMIHAVPSGATSTIALISPRF